MDCGVLPGEAYVAQHRLVRAKIMLKEKISRKIHARKRIKLWKLKEEEKRRDYEENLKEHMRQARLCQGLTRPGEQVCGVTSGIARHGGGIRGTNCN